MTLHNFFCLFLLYSEGQKRGHKIYHPRTGKSIIVIMMLILMKIVIIKMIMMIIKIIITKVYILIILIY